MLASAKNSWVNEFWVWMKEATGGLVVGDSNHLERDKLFKVLQSYTYSANQLRLTDLCWLQPLVLGFWRSFRPYVNWCPSVAIIKLTHSPERVFNHLSVQDILAIMPWYFWKNNVHRVTHSRNAKFCKSIKLCLEENDGGNVRNQNGNVGRTQIEQSSP